MSGLAKLFKWICGIALALVAMAYIGYRIYWDFMQPIDTSTVYEYTVSKLVTAQGIAVRDEYLLDEAATGIEYYPCEDGSRVAVGEVVAELRRGGRVQSDERRRELEKEMEHLLEAQATAVDFTNTQVFNRDIKQDLAELSSMASAGRYEDLPELRQSLTVSYNKKMISGGKAIDYSARLEQLRSQLSAVERDSVAETAATIVAPESGYFSHSVDGLEGMLQPDALGDYSVERITALISQGGQTPAVSRAGKMVLRENWVFAAAISSDECDWISDMMINASKRRAPLQVQLELERVGQTVPATVTDLIQQKDGETAVLLLECNWMNEELINLRVEDAKIHFKEYTGLRINTADLRFRSNSDGTQDRGVYIVRNNKVYFRLVDPIYEEPGFLLSKSYYTQQEFLEPQRQQRIEENPQVPEPEPLDLTVEEQDASDEEEESVQDEYKYYVIMFDQVITKGNDLYHEKVLRDY